MKVGDIVRLTEDSIHWGMFEDIQIPKECIVIEVDKDMGDEQYLVEFSSRHNCLHDGGQGDDDYCRYWVDSVELVEEVPDILREAVNEGDVEFMREWAVDRPEPPRPRQGRIDDIAPQHRAINWIHNNL